MAVCSGLMEDIKYGASGSVIYLAKILFNKEQAAQMGNLVSAWK